jgi:hypothetical protein
VAQQPDHWGAAVGSEHGIVGCISVDKVGQVLWMDCPSSAGGSPFVEYSKCALMTFRAIVEEPCIATQRKPRNERVQCRFNISYHTNLNRVTATEVSRINIDLNDPGVTGIELAPRKIAAKQSWARALGGT